MEQRHPQGAADRGRPCHCAGSLTAPVPIRYNSEVNAPSPPPQRRPARLRWAWWLLAYASLGLGILGAFLPGLPTTVFILIAAYAASRGSERLHQRLLAHRHFGPIIGNWQRHRAVPRKAKWAASWAMLVSAVILLGAMLVSRGHAPWMIALPIGCMACVALWLWTRPEPPA
jgi:uncharacterized protein